MHKVNAKALRERCGSASSMAKRIDMTDAAIFKLLNGERKPSYRMISKFKTAYGFTPEELDRFFFSEEDEAAETAKAG